MFAKLWNRKYHLRPWHHLLCGIAAVATLIVAVAWPITTYVMAATNAVDQLWQKHLAADEKRLDLEGPPGDGRSFSNLASACLRTDWIRSLPQHQNSPVNPTAS